MNPKIVNATKTPPISDLETEDTVLFNEPVLITLISVDDPYTTLRPEMIGLAYGWNKLPTKQYALMIKVWENESTLNLIYGVDKWTLNTDYEDIIDSIMNNRPDLSPIEIINLFKEIFNFLETELIKIKTETNISSFNQWNDLGSAFENEPLYATCPICNNKIVLDYYYNSALYTISEHYVEKHIGHYSKD